MKTNEKAKITRCFTPLASEIVAFLCQQAGGAGVWRLFDVSGGIRSHRQKFKTKGYWQLVSPHSRMFATRRFKPSMFSAPRTTSLPIT